MITQSVEHLLNLKVTGVEEIRIADPSGLCKAEDATLAAGPSTPIQPIVHPSPSLPWPTPRTFPFKEDGSALQPPPIDYKIVPHIPARWSKHVATRAQWGEGLPPVETPLWEKNWQSRQQASPDEGNPTISK